MTAAMILTIIQGLSSALPEVVALFQKAQSGQPVSESDVQAALSNYQLAHSQLDAAIAAQTPNPGGTG
jgi:hypothetical protein